MKSFKATIMKKSIAFVFASSLITLYLSTNLYSAYVFKTYGMAKRGHHGGHGNHSAAKPAKKETPVMKCTAGKCGGGMKKT
jgi:hypothetical protein